MDTASLHYFLYLSRAVRPFEEPELETLLAGARRFNERHGVSGLLLYDYTPGFGLGQFCQYVEGTPEALALVRARIDADASHTAIHHLDQGPAPERLFRSWAMGYQPASAAPDLEGFRALIDVTVPTTGAMKRPAALLRVFLKMSNTAQAAASGRVAASADGDGERVG